MHARRKSSTSSWPGKLRNVPRAVGARLVPFPRRRPCCTRRRPGVSLRHHVLPCLYAPLSSTLPAARSQTVAFDDPPGLSHPSVTLGRVRPSEQGELMIVGLVIGIVVGGGGGVVIAWALFSARATATVASERERHAEALGSARAEVLALQAMLEHERAAADERKLATDEVRAAARGRVRRVVTPGARAATTANSSSWPTPASPTPSRRREATSTSAPRPSSSCSPRCATSSAGTNRGCGSSSSSARRPTPA